MTKSILLVGVGGQGTILAGKIITSGLLSAGYDVKMSEIHGMSQRGGSVSTHVRYGERVQSPVIELGGADLLVAFELMEAVRWLEYKKPDGLLIVNNYKIKPMPVLIGSAVYSNDLLNALRGYSDIFEIDGFNESAAHGGVITMNLLLLGAAVTKAGLGSIEWNKIIESEVKQNFWDVNKRAFERGCELAK
ncbi:MAG: indolepyruvate oxidoreductase subunit beta [Clostridiales bacterium]|nr:indolepyruvate oxidoreductase subunit beta [Clostridiales bacterium]